MVLERASTSGDETPGRRFVMVRFAWPLAAVTLVLVLGQSAQVAAQELAPDTTNEVTAAAAPAASAQTYTSPPALLSERRPAALMPLYASFVTLQVLDLHSTTYALERGAVEANPAMKGFVDNTAAMTALKAAGTAGVIFVSEKLRTKNKAAALGLMIGTNVAMTWVVQHNYRMAR
jgi:hypothetical protein